MLLTGVPTTTFCFPADLFPKEVRSSCNGIAAAAGKIGAFIGAFAIPYLYEWAGMGVIFYMCGALSALGVVVTLVYIPVHSSTSSSALDKKPSGSFPAPSPASLKGSLGSTSPAQNNPLMGSLYGSDPSRWSPVNNDDIVVREVRSSRDSSDNDDHNQGSSEKSPLLAP